MRRLRLTAACLTGLLVALSTASSWAQAQDADTVQPRASVTLSPWVEPLPLALAVDGAARGELVLYLPIGLTFAADGVPLNVEYGMAVLRGAPNTGPSNPIARAMCAFECWFAGVGFGPSLRLTGPDPISGLFVEPRVTAFVGSVSSKFAATLGIDIGYRFRLGSLYLAPLLGVGVGVGGPEDIWGQGRNDFAPVVFDPSRYDSSWRYGFRLNLLRIGWAPHGLPGPIGASAPRETRFAVMTTPLVFGLPDPVAARTGPRFSVSALAPAWRGHVRLGFGYRDWGGPGWAGSSTAAALVAASYSLVKGLGGELAVEMSLRGEASTANWYADTVFAGGAGLHAVYRFRRGPVYLGASVGPAVTAGTGSPWWRQVQPATAFVSLTLESTQFVRLQLEVEPLLIGVAF